MLKHSCYVWCYIAGAETCHSRSTIMTYWFWEKHKVPEEIGNWINKIFIELREKGINPVMKNCGIIKF